MSKITALAISVSILGGIATWLFLSVGTILIWAAFVAWACFYFSGGDEAALKSTIASNIFGVIVASTTAVVILAVPMADQIGANIWASLVVTASIAIYILAANIAIISSIPGTTLGYAATFAYLLQTPDRLSLQAVLSLSLESSYLVVPLSMVIGALFAYASAKAAEVISVQTQPG
ncbi:DUF1097 domain-containing protein [Rhizobiales bacterium]|uniref:DUF1097 domain-containing protein n=1 Tax=Hongsoonwoonella zoysiae TaxID=2821844 RepID=UPI001560D763|nr:DUF1097 domain-containing protein [Hongsoonwoonella zoysiae]NRG16239.1 DUF1097 domain-containing protein [Hongsoonwoonella zoysiae]